MKVTTLHSLILPLAPFDTASCLWLNGKQWKALRMRNATFRLNPMSSFSFLHALGERMLLLH